MTLPEYEHPPVVEVVCGITFKPFPELTTAHIGKLWNELGADFKNVVEVDPIPAIFERFESPLQVQEVDISDHLFRRIWFGNAEGDQIVQLQQDRFLCNWRKTKPEHDYPRYNWVVDKFDQHLAKFEAFAESNFGRRPEALQFELTYINHIASGDRWSTIAEIGNVLPELGWRANPSRFLPAPERFDVNLAFPMPDKKGRLHVRSQTGFRANGKTGAVLELAARGYDENRRDWFALAHQWIVKGFEDLTDAKQQKDVWLKK